MQPKTRAGKFDWAEISRAYIHSDSDLYMFAREKTKNPNHPTLATLQARYYERGWAKLRAARIKQELIEAEGKEQAYQSEVVQVALTSTEQLLNANAAIMRHIQASQELQRIGFELIPKFQKALPDLDLTEMAASDPKGFIGALKVVTDFINVATDIERKAIGASDLKIELAINQSDDREVLSQKLEALKDMDQDELLKNYFALASGDSK